MDPTQLTPLLAATSTALAAALALGWWRQRDLAVQAQRRIEELEAAVAAAALEPEAEPAPGQELGPLAREIGHDFNNVLAIISTTSEVLLMELTQPELSCDDERLESSLRQVHAAAQRGAALATRLLAAGRAAAPPADSR